MSRHLLSCKSTKQYSCDGWSLFSVCCVILLPNQNDCMSCANFSTKSLKSSLVSLCWVSGGVRGSSSCSRLFLNYLQLQLQLHWSQILLLFALTVQGETESNTPWSQNERSIFSHLRALRKVEIYPSSVEFLLLPHGSVMLLPPRTVPLRGEPWSQTAQSDLQSSFDNLFFFVFLKRIARHSRLLSMLLLARAGPGWELISG